MLRKVPKPRLIMVFTGVVTVGIIIVGFLFNLLIWNSSLQVNQQHTVTEGEDHEN